MVKVPSANKMGQTLKECPSCRKTKRLWSFHEPKQDIILDVCKSCHKTQLDRELMQIVMQTLKDMGV